eukprot:10397820-Alexandrium_andersonii.AAC.1
MTLRKCLRDAKKHMSCSATGTRLCCWCQVRGDCPLHGEQGPVRVLTEGKARQRPVIGAPDAAVEQPPPGGARVPIRGAQEGGESGEEPGHGELPKREGSRVHVCLPVLPGESDDPVGNRQVETAGHA